MAGSVNKVKSNSFKHGHASKDRTPTYLSWRSMFNRKRKKGSVYDGIEICERWVNFVDFLEDMGERPEGKTLDRIDNKKGYVADNCQWSTYLDQTRNRCNNIEVVYKGQKRLLMDITRELNLNHRRVRERFKYMGWSIEDAIEKEKQC